RRGVIAKDRGSPQAAEQSEMARGQSRRRHQRLETLRAGGGVARIGPQSERRDDADEFPAVHFGSRWPPARARFAGAFRRAVSGISEVEAVAATSALAIASASGGAQRRARSATRGDRPCGRPPPGPRTELAISSVAFPSAGRHKCRPYWRD